MSFAFNFFEPEGQENVATAAEADVSTAALLNSGTNSYEQIYSSCRAQRQGDKILELEIPSDSSRNCDAHKLCYYTSCSESSAGQQCSNFEAVEKYSETDLIPNVYEGGFKVWECSIDLVQFLSTLQHDFSGQKVLELGCGCGLPGICTLLRGADVDFQDFNKEVLQFSTIPNCEQNLKQLMNPAELPAASHDKPSTEINPTPAAAVLDLLDQRCTFYASDWQTFAQKIQPQRYDIILASETIYSPKNYKSLLAVMETGLKKTGKIYLAAKSYYFGVGGSVREFQEVVKEAGKFSCEQVHTVQDQGVQREILKLQWLKDVL